MQQSITKNFAVLALVSLTTSCVEDTATPTSADPVSAMGLVESLPIDDIANQIKEMPDGIHLRPGVDVWEMAPPTHPFILLDEHSSQVVVLPPAWDAFSPVGPNDVVFVKDMAFIVDSVERGTSEWVYEVSEVDLSRLIWGNFSIPWQVSLLSLADSPDDIIVVDPLLDPAENVIRPNALSNELVLFDKSFSRKLTLSTKQQHEGSIELKGSLRLPAVMDGKFEGRIGSFKSNYNCLNPKDDDFCVDYMAAWAETTLNAKVGAKASIAGSLSSTPDAIPIFDKMVGSVPLGPTGLTINVNFFVRLQAEAKATAKIDAEIEYEYTKTIPFGFGYRNKPRNRGVFAIPNPGKPATGGSGRFTKKFVSFDGVLEAKSGLELGVEFSLGALGNTAKLRGIEIFAALENKVSYYPLRSSECLESAVQVVGKAKVELEFEVDLRLWKWSDKITCTNYTCAEVSSDPIYLLRNTFSEMCVGPGRFDTLVIEPIDDGTGYADVTGYDVDSVCLTRTPPPTLAVRSPTPVVYCATSGPTQLRGKPDSTCPMTTSKVAGLTGRTEIKFSREFLPGDVFTIVQKNGSGDCNGSGRAKFSVKGPAGSRSLKDGAYFENNVNITFE